MERAGETGEKDEPASPSDFQLLTWNKKPHFFVLPLHS